MPSKTGLADAEGEVLAVGDAVELLAVPGMPWPEWQGRRGVIIHVPQDDPNDPNIIMEFVPADPYGASGVTTRANHVRKVAG